MLDATKVYDGRTKIIRLFENSSIKPSNYPHNVKFEPDEHNIEGKFEPKEYDGVKNSIGERTKSGKQKYNKLDKMIIRNDKIISKELFKNYFFNFESLFDMQEKLGKTKNAQKDKELVRQIQSGLFDLKKEMEKMSKDEIDIEKPDVIVYTVERILDFNKQYQQGQGLKILTPQQMLSRLPIFLAQLKAGNNSEKRKNEKRQLLYSL